ncbi:phosphoribosylpyrophosphate synthetase [Cytophagales bacterium RKSG123]|nr:phosphoribosylpyrophosphate synthetase [Xanthovirga aplysinae]
MKNYITPLSFKLHKLEEKGYVNRYVMTEKGMKCSETGVYYQPEEMLILAEYRFEEESDAGDSSIVYAVETTDGQKGTVINAYGTYADQKVDNFMMKVPVSRKAA